MDSEAQFRSGDRQITVVRGHHYGIRVVDTPERHTYLDAASARGELCGKEVTLQMNALYLRVMELIHRDEEGQGLAEYALILALIAIIAIVALIFLGGQVSKILSTVGNSV
jgi:pilus assembly protein Flp/PilA